MRSRRFEGEEEKRDQIVLTACCSCGAKFSRDCAFATGQYRVTSYVELAARTF